MARSGRRPSSGGARRGSSAKRSAPRGAAPKRTPKAATSRDGLATRNAPGRDRADAPRRDDPTVVSEEARVLRLGAVPGTTPGRWIDTWKRRMPHVPLELVPLSFAAQHPPLADGTVDLALVREPFPRDGMHAIPLYEEVPVVIAPVDSPLLAVDELDPGDLAGEVLLRTREDVLGPLELPAEPASIPELATVADAVETVATGVEILVAPMSLARLHHRKDVGHRPLRGGPVSTVLLAWPADRTTADVETFIGIVRGRTENSSR